MSKGIDDSKTLKEMKKELKALKMKITILEEQNTKEGNHIINQKV